MSDPASPHPAADRNLLFGILAVQMDFISRDALIRAMNAWVLEKSKPLGRILLEQGALREEEHALLEALAQKHLQKHDNDPARSLAALSSVESVRSDLKQQITDPEVQASLGYPTATPPPQGDPYATASLPTAGTPTSSGLRFRILRPHAKGGLGEVFVAEDQELHRHVALKEIQGRHADHPESRARFLLEAEVTGVLEHPGVVPVYGLGQYADGRPFYAMRFIEGDSLKEAVARFHGKDSAPQSPADRALQLRQLLGRFVDVCNAIAYAHSRGVLHRDLKPGNVMLGQYGETLVVDWGLAKPLGRPETTAGLPRSSVLSSSGVSGTETQMGQALGTPQFMSPEQARGDLDSLGPASDVYSLGATLYQVLTGRPAFTDADVGEVLHKVQHGDFPPPRRLNPEVPPALEAICLKAMALKPGDRYPTARALADDVEHWLADEPVTAYRDPLGARLARWARRHRPLVAAAAGLLVTAVVALAVSTVLISREQARTQEQRQLAEANFQTALHAVNDMLTEVAEDQLVYEPRMEQKRRHLLEKARTYYQEFLDQKGNDVALRKETALASERLGDIDRLLGHREPAAADYTKAIDDLTRLAAEYPAESDYRWQLARSHDYRGEVRRTTDPPEAEKDYRRAVELLEALRAEGPGRPEFRRDLANTEDNLGILLKDTRRPEDAEKAFRRAIDLLDELVRAEGGNAEDRHLLARAYLNLGSVLRPAGRNEEAEKAYREAIRQQQELVRANEDVPDYRYELAVTDNNLGIVLARAGRYDAAGTAYGEGIKLLDRLVVDFPNVPDYRKQRANAQSNLAVALGRQKKWREAAEVLKAALAGYDELLRRADHGKREQEPEYRGGRGRAEGNLGWVLLEQKDARQARGYLEDGIKDVRTALEFNANDPAYLATLRDEYRNLGHALLDLGDPAGAAQAAEKLAAVQADGNREDDFQAALVLAECAARGGKDATSYADRAVALLRQAVARGFADPAALDREAFGALRQRDDFRQLAAELKARKP